MSKEELLDVVLTSMSDNDMEVSDKTIESNQQLIDQVFMLAGITLHDDKIHASQYDEHIEQAREILILKEQGRLN
jgi:hypothetical protein